MEYNVDKQKLEEGLHELMKTEINKLEHWFLKSSEFTKTCLEGNVDYFKKGFYQKLDVLKEDYTKLKDLCSQFIDTSEYDNKFWKELIYKAEEEFR